MLGSHPDTVSGKINKIRYQQFSRLLEIFQSVKVYIFFSGGILSDYRNMS